MFEVQNINIGRFEGIRLVNAATGEYLEVLTDFGAGVNDLVVLNDNGVLVSVIDGYKTEEEIWDCHHQRFKGSKLSPFPNRVRAGSYAFRGKTYQLPINEVASNNSLHAFLNYASFKGNGASAGADQAEVNLVHEYKGTECGYPFPYLLKIKYTFSEAGVRIDTDIKNIGTSDQPIGDGWHPYFQFENIDEVKLKLGAVKNVASEHQAHSPVFENLMAIGETSWDDCFEVLNGASRHDIILEDTRAGVRLALWQNCNPGGYRYFQVYTPSDRKTIAIEPVTCPPNAFNTHEGLIELKPNEMVSMSFGIEKHTTK